MQESRNLLDENQAIYDNLWSCAWLLEAEQFNTWPLINLLLERCSKPLEVAPGLRPRLPSKGTTYVDISMAALKALKQAGGRSLNASISNLPFPDKTFDLVCALDIIEHVEDDEGALAELSRVATDNATLILSTPLHPELWTPFDEFVGHYRRYEPEKLIALLTKNGFNVEKSAIFGMKPKSSRLTDLGMWFLRNKQQRAMWWYNRIFPYIARRQKPLTLSEGLIPMGDIGEVFLICKRLPR